MKTHGWLCCKTVAAFAVASVVVWTAGCDARPAAEAATVAVAQPKPAPQPSPVAAEAPTPIAAAEFKTTGPLVAEQQSDIAAERDGRVAKIAVELGDDVAKGELLAALDDRALQVAVQSQTAKLTSLRAQVREWEAEEKMDGADLRRADEMLASKILSQESWEHIKYKLDEVTAEVARYRADELAAEADLSAAKLQLEQSRIVAPFAGVVGRESLRPAQEVKKGDVLFWLTAVAPLRVLFTVPESVMSAYPIGAPLELTTTTLPGLHQRARVLRVSPVVDPASDSVQVVGALAHPSPLLKPGMSMQIALPEVHDKAIKGTATR